MACKTESLPKGEPIVGETHSNASVEVLKHDLPPWASMSSMGTSIPYSSKAIPFPEGKSLKNSKCNVEKRGYNFTFGVDVSAPFAHCTLAPHLRASRSSPLLAPLK